VQVREVNNTDATVALWDDVTIASLRSSGQILEMFLDVVHLFIRNCTLVNLAKKKYVKTTARKSAQELKDDLLLEVLKSLSDTGLQRGQEILLD